MLDMFLTFGNSRIYIKVILYVYDLFELSELWTKKKLQDVCHLASSFSNWHNFTYPADDSANTQSPPGGLSWRNPSKHCKETG